MRRLIALLLLLPAAALADPGRFYTRPRSPQHARERALVQHQALARRIPARQYDRLRAEVKQIVQRVRANPRAALDAAAIERLGAMSPLTRAKVLSEVAGLDLHKVRVTARGRTIDKVRLTVKPGEVEAFQKVFGPNVVEFIPGGGHSYFRFGDKVVDLLWGYRESSWRPTERTTYPVFLTDAEAARLHDYIRAAERSTDATFGQWNVHRMKKGTFWEYNCTSWFGRAPIGERTGRYAWIDRLEAGLTAKAGRVRAVAGLGEKPLLEALDAVPARERAEKLPRIFADLKSHAALTAEEKRWAADLEREVMGVVAQLPGFPLHLVGRQSFGEIAGFEAAANPGSEAWRSFPWLSQRRAADPMSPKSLAKLLRASDRVPVIVEHQAETAAF